MGTNNNISRHGYITPCYNLYMSSNDDTSAVYNIRTADNEDTNLLVFCNKKTGKSISTYTGEYLKSQGIHGLVSDCRYHICVDGANVSFELQ